MYIAWRLPTIHLLSTNFDRYMDLLKLQATTATSVAEAMYAITNLEIYGYKAIPTLRDILHDSNNEEVKECCRVIMRNAGWLPL